MVRVGISVLVLVKLCDFVDCVVIVVAAGVGVRSGVVGVGRIGVFWFAAGVGGCGCAWSGVVLSVCDCAGVCYWYGFDVCGYVSGLWSFWI